MSLLGDERALAELTHAEKQLLRDKLADAIAQLGVPVIHPDSADTPGEMVCALEPHRQHQRPHLEAIDGALRWVHDTPDAALMIWTPPQVGKSWRTSRAFPFWWLAHHPRDRILLGSYELKLARAHALATRLLIENYGRPFGLVPDRSEWTSTDFTLLSKGGVRVRGVGGGLTGHPGHLGLIDDPYSGRQAADSPTIRETVWNWYSSVFTARLAPGARQVITMTRWHPDDLCGALLKRDGRLEDGGRWRVLHLPAIAMAPDPERGFREDPLGRAPGEPLTHPAVAPDDTRALIAHWANQKARSTIRDWDAMYQGSPYRSEGATLTEADVRAATGEPPAEFRRTGVGVDPSGGGRDTCGLIAAGVGADRTMWWTHDWTAVMGAGDWADQACLLAALVDADVFVIEVNYGGDQATTLIRRAWTTLLAAGELVGADGAPLRANTPCPRVVAVHSRKSKILRAEPIGQAVKLLAARFARGDQLANFKREWTLWEPDSTWSPGALDAGVHLAYELLPPPGQTGGVHSVAKRLLGQAKEGPVASRKVSR